MASSLMEVQNKRKEKARIAARARRSQEANIIMEMASELHITQEKLRRIDKATIVKLAIDYIKAFEVLCQRQKPREISYTPTNHTISSLVQHHQMLHRHHDETTCTREEEEEEEEGEDIENDEYYEENELLQRHIEVARGDELDDEEEQAQAQDERRLQEAQEHNSTTNNQENEPEDDQQQQQRQKPQQQQQRQQQQLQPCQDQQERTEQKHPLFSAPKLATASIFASKTVDNMNSHFLMIEVEENGKSSFVLKPDTEILDDDDLTHLAPQAGDISISLEAEPLDGIPLHDLLVLSPVR